jgi:uncharacterized protein YhaN
MLGVAANVVNRFVEICRRNMLAMFQFRRLAMADKVKFTRCVPRRRRDLEFSIPNPIVAFFLWAAKSDPRILRSCAPWTRRTQVAKGFFVTSTAVWSAVAAHYFLSTTVALSPEVVSIGSVGWGCAIFMFDRELVGHWSRKSLSIRVVLSAALSLTVAIPVEMRIFQGRIDLQISRGHADENRAASDRLRQKQDTIDEAQHELEKQLSAVRSQIPHVGEVKQAEAIGRQIADQTTGVRGEGKAYSAAADRLKLLQDQQSDIEKQLQGLANDRSRITADFRDQEITSAHDFLTRFEAMRAAAPTFSPMWMLSWLLTILFVVVDMFPVLMKAIVPPSDYDHFLGIQQRENIHRAERIAVYNECVTEHDFLTPQPSTLELFERVFGDERPTEQDYEEQVAA